MSHPFQKMFEKALKKSDLEDNIVFEKAEELLKKGYRKEEILEVLVKLQKSLIDDGEATIVGEAVLEFKTHFEDEE